MEEFEKNFNDYVEQFNFEDSKIKYKYGHSYRVMDLSYNIALSEGLDDEDLNLIKIAALLHDIGRFNQVKGYNTFFDCTSIDHGLEGYNLLKQDNFISQFVENPLNQGTVLRVVKDHNKYDIDKSTKGKDLLFLKIIRDADKIDILENGLVTNDESPISEEIKNLFFHKKLVNYEKIFNENEQVICHLSYIFDINYEYSLKYIQKNKLIENLFNKIKNKKIFEEYINFIENYINERIGIKC